VAGGIPPGHRRHDDSRIPITTSTPGISARHSKMNASRLRAGRSASIQAGSSTNSRGASAARAAAGLAADSESSVSQMSGFPGGSSASRHGSAGGIRSARPRRRRRRIDEEPVGQHLVGALDVAVAGDGTAAAVQAIREPLEDSPG